MTNKIYVTRTFLPDYDDYVSYLPKLWESRWLTNNGEFVKELESKLTKYLGIKRISLLSNGTLSLQIALKLFKKNGGEIITTPFTFIATTNSILWEGFDPVFVDIDLDTFNLNPEEIEKKITAKTVAIVPVHVYGNPCYVDEIEKIAKKYGLKIIYDAAHAFGVEYKNQSVLNFGDISSISFHSTKLFQTIEGGALVTNNEEYYQKISLLRNFGIKEFTDGEQVDEVGINAKMNEFQAIMGICNLRKIDDNIRKRKMIYEIYSNELKTIKNIKLQKIIASRYNYAYFPVILPSPSARSSVIKILNENNIFPRKYFYPLTNEFAGVKKHLNKSVIEVSNAKYISERVLCLPLYSDLETAVVKKIITLFKKALLTS